MLYGPVEKDGTISCKANIKDHMTKPLNDHAKPSSPIDADRRSRRIQGLGAFFLSQLMSRACHPHVGLVVMQLMDFCSHENELTVLSVRFADITPPTEAA